MKATDFNTGWSYRHLDETGEAFAPVHIPHDAMLHEPRTELAISGLNSGWFEGRDYEYVKQFTPGRELEGHIMILEFEGVYHRAEVWVNGEKVAFRPYGYTNFYVDVTDHVTCGHANEIRVIARNADQPNSRWYSGAGIYRPVTLWTAERDHIGLDGIEVKTLSIDPPRVEVTVQCTSPGTVGVDVMPNDSQPEGSEAELADILNSLCSETKPTNENGEASFTLELSQAKLWSPNDPNLYSCRVRFEADSGAADDYVTTFGIRTLEWGRRGMLLNGERIIVQGACIHHDNGILGACAYADAEERKIRLMREQGYNAIRSAHNPCSKALLDACDRLGIMVMDEYIDHWYIHKTLHDYVEYFERWWRPDVKEMVLKDRNHPSVIMYSIGNEVSETAQRRGIQLTQEMTGYVHELDATRPVTCGVNIFFNLLSSLGLGVYSDKKAQQESIDSEKRRSSGKVQNKRRLVGSEFFNTLAGILGAEFMKTGATLHGCDVKTRDAFAELDIAGYNYGIKRYAKDLKKYPDRLIVGSETFCSDAYTFRELAKKHTRLIGDFVWAGMDYLGESGVGAWEYDDYCQPSSSGFGWLTAGSGRVDLSGKPLGEALYTRVALEAENGPYIAVRPVNHTGDKHTPSAWKMTNAIDSWSWNGYEGHKADVEVYARAAEVALLVNGQEVGRKKLSKTCNITFRCTYQTGEVEAVSYDAAGQEIGRRRMVSASEHTQLQAEPESANFTPGHLVFIRVRYTDENGIGKPLERGTLHAQVEGGTLLGFGSAAPFNVGSFVSGTTETYFGEAIAAVLAPPRSNQALTFSITDGKHSASCSIPVIAK